MLVMNPSLLQNQLLKATEASDFLLEATSVTESLKGEGAGLESVSVILKFMEDHPVFDFGAPGPLAHFVETFYGQGYEAELLASIARKPTSHTVWLLNRVINGTKQTADRERLINALRQAESHPASDPQAKHQAEHFLRRLSL
jgi:hypothetical protein